VKSIKGYCNQEQSLPQPDRGSGAFRPHASPDTLPLLPSYAGVSFFTKYKGLRSLPYLTRFAPLWQESEFSLRECVQVPKLGALY
jgi:hypothetical protein